jgi:hypothetical protein
MKRSLWLIFLLYVSKTTCFSQDNNPFSVYHGKDTIAVATTSTTNSAEVADQADLNKLDGENPFTISHIPIRKNQYKKIESLRTSQQSSDKETISISYLPLWIAFLSLCLLAYMLFLKRNHINVLIRSALNDNFLRMTSYDEDFGKTWPYVLGYSLFIINISLFIFLLLQKVFSINQSNILLWVFLACVVFFVGKHLVGSFFAWIYGIEKEMQLYQFLINCFRNIMSLIFLGLNIILVFGSQNWSKAIGIVGIGVFLIFLLSRYYKGIKIARTYINSHFFQFFIYFCAFEFSPWIVTYKVVQDLL